VSIPRFDFIGGSKPPPYNFDFALIPKASRPSPPTVLIWRFCFIGGSKPPPYNFDFALIPGRRGRRPLRCQFRVFVLSAAASHRPTILILH